MKRRLPIALLLLSLAGLLCACAEGTDPMNTRGIEERYLGMGQAHELYRAGQQLLREGRYREAQASFYSAELKAYTADLREAARARRLWLQEVITAYEEGRTPPPPPVVLYDEPPFGQEPIKPVVPDEPPASSGPDNTLRDPAGRPILPPLRPAP